MIRISEIVDNILEYNPDADVDIIDRAYVFSAKTHHGQMRLSGEPYLTHPLEVAGILSKMRLDVYSIAAGLLHDVVEDSRTTVEEIEDMFGPEIAHIVSGVTKISKLNYQSAQMRQAESMRKMILAMADDIRVILVKLADRVHNMDTLKFHKSEQKKISIAQETHDIYAPIAGRLGIFWMKNKLDTIAFQYIHPEEYEKIKTLVNKNKDERVQYIEMVQDSISKKMNEVGIKCIVKGRYKQDYSIYSKMISQQLDFEEIYDIVAFRIILDTKAQCYEVLGLLHSMWRPIANKFKDYIGSPKANMYQSLHTTVLGPNGERVEIQIRTQEMDDVAEAGIAAHWSYKEGNTIDEKTGKTFAWIQNLIETQENYSDPDEFMENVRIDLFPGEIYVFTPKGDIITLPKGATPVDFAYRIHTEVGDKCSGSRVNRRLVALDSQLRSGDNISIITSNGHTPSKDWLNFVKTVKARSKIRQWIKNQEKDRSLTLGRELCEKAFRKSDLNYNTFAKSKEMALVVEAFNYKTLDDMIANVGYGKITPLQIIHKIAPDIKQPEDKKKSLFQKFNPLSKKSKQKKSCEGIIVRGLNDILVKFGKCCSPVPGDSIIGYITQGQGVTIHRKTCINALKLNPDRKIEVAWHHELTEKYPVKICVHSTDKVGLLAEITTAIAKANTNILHVNTETLNNQLVNTHFTISVESTAHLKKTISVIKKVKHIQSVYRVDD